MARRMVEVEGDKLGGFFKFTQLGQSIEGVFLRKRVSTSGSYGPQDVYDIRVKENEVITVNGNADLDSKMSKVPPNTFVRITFVNNQDTGKGNPMKLFKVEKEAAGGEDIPF